MSKRPKMLASTIRELIAPIVRTCPKECGIVSISDIEVSTDFAYATLYISALQDPKRAIIYLESRHHDLQKSLSALNRKHIPILRFRVDPRGEKAGRIEELLDKLS